MCGDGDGDGGGGRSANGAENSEDEASVVRHSDGGLATTAACARSWYCSGAWATGDGANMLPRRLCDVAETLLVLALTLAPVTEGGEGIGGVNWTGSGAALNSRSA